MCSMSGGPHSTALMDHSTCSGLKNDIEAWLKCQRKVATAGNSLFAINQPFPSMLQYYNGFGSQNLQKAQSWILTPQCCPIIPPPQSISPACIISKCFPWSFLIKSKSCFFWRQHLSSLQFRNSRGCFVWSLPFRAYNNVIITIPH